MYHLASHIGAGLNSLNLTPAPINSMKGLPINKNVITEDQIRERAYRLAKDYPWRSPIENWRDAENQLNNESRHKIFFLIWKPLCNAAKWAFASDKKGFDLLTSLSIPILLAVGGWWISHINDRRQEDIAANAQRDLILAEYIKDMKPYIKNIIDKQKVSRGERFVVTSVLAETAMERLSITDSNSKPLPSKQKGAAIVFLNRTGLLSPQHVNLQTLNLSGADLTQKQLNRANFVGANLNGAILRNAFLEETNLRMAQLQGADLQGAELSGADLRGTDAPPSKNVSNSHEYYTNLCGAKFDENAIKKLVESKKVKSNAQTIWPWSPPCASPD
jgi:hypothetical protein